MEAVLHTLFSLRNMEFSSGYNTNNRILTASAASPITRLYNIAEDSAPFGVPENNQFFLPITKGLIAFSALLFDKPYTNYKISFVN